MSAEALYARLAEIAVEIEKHAAATWLLEVERSDVRTQLRRLNAIPTLPKAAA
jgi:hypothetical protein